VYCSRKVLTIKNRDDAETVKPKAAASPAALNLKFFEWVLSAQFTAVIYSSMIFENIKKKTSQNNCITIKIEKGNCMNNR